jgi:hypothetical protein
MISQDTKRHRSMALACGILVLGAVLTMPHAASADPAPSDIGAAPQRAAMSDRSDPAPDNAPPTRDQTGAAPARAVFGTGWG